MSGGSPRTTTFSPLHSGQIIRVAAAARGGAVAEGLLSFSVNELTFIYCVAAHLIPFAYAHEEPVRVTSVRLPQRSAGIATAALHLQRSRVARPQGPRYLTSR